ncbi:hypothetical protein M436DRAFT_62890 [Aureobasidium namibiae CBS 147.97]|uniref:Uncharacterized protein n=1 Tax=Aureobasidium namibiae CBS 147.97 TaxID=1043004 RepID=A0A074WN26_9PEZI
MAPSTPPDITVSDSLSELRIEHPVATMHHNTPDSTGQHTQSNRVKLTLETLPPEIKNEIFSHFLLAAKVNQNEFALISSKFFAFEIDRRRFLPTVATAKAARTFRNPAIEATITHVGETLCVCCNPQKHKGKDRATHALFLVADLEHLMRELRLTYHMWPSKPIYIMSESDVTPVEHVPVNVDTQIKVVWKVNPSHRQDFTVTERRARQVRLLDPLNFSTGCGKRISVVGVDKDIVHKVVGQETPRVLSINAVGWDLYNLLKAQKRYLDTILSQDSARLLDLIHSYTDLACAGWPLNIIGFWKNASVTTDVNMHGRTISLCLLPFDELDEEDYQTQIADSWQMAVLCLVFDCLCTIAKLCLKNGDNVHLRDCIQLIADLDFHTFRPNHRHLIPASLRVLLSHYVAWLRMHEPSTLADDAVTLGKSMLDQARGWLSADDQDDVWRPLNTDSEFLSRVTAGEAELRSNNFGSFPISCVNFQGLLNRPRLHKTLSKPKPPREAFQGWAFPRDFPKPEVAAHMTKFSDDIVKLKFEERNPGLAEDALDHGHVPFVVLNFPREPEEEPDLPPGFPPGILPPGLLAGGFGIQVGPVTTLGALMGNMGMPGGAPQP